MQTLLYLLRPVSYDTDERIAPWHTFTPMASQRTVYLYLAVCDASLNVCSICLQPLYDPCLYARTTPCSHVFHTECLDSWWKAGSADCPLCRRRCVPSLTNET